MSFLELALYDLARLFLLPVLLLILLALAYSFIVLGRFLVEGLQRFRRRFRSPLLAYAVRSRATSDDLELWVMRQLEWLRIVSRTTPMLGLVATMIPMGPALLSLSQNDDKAIGENLVVAFSAVILALISASVTFFVLTIRRRWLLQDLREAERTRGER